jgi:hypothetical protein
MYHKFVFTALMFLCCYTNGFAQVESADNSYKSTKLDVTMDSCFVKVLFYLQNHNYFIENVDKVSGFIRAKSFVKKSNKMFSPETGEKRTLTVLLSPSGKETLLSLNMYIETLNRGGNTSTFIYYYEDKGIVNEPAVYQKLIADLKKEIN